MNTEVPNAPRASLNGTGYLHLGVEILIARGLSLSVVRKAMLRARKLVIDDFSEALDALRVNEPHELHPSVCVAPDGVVTLRVGPHAVMEFGHDGEVTMEADEATTALYRRQLVDEHAGPRPDNILGVILRLIGAAGQEEMLAPEDAAALESMRRAPVAFEQEAAPSAPLPRPTSSVVLKA